MDLLELFNFGEKNVVFFSGDNSISNSDSNNYFLGTRKELEISYLKIIINMMDKESK